VEGFKQSADIKIQNSKHNHSDGTDEEANHTPVELVQVKSTGEIGR